MKFNQCSPSLLGNLVVSRVLASVYASFYQRNPNYFIRQLSYAAGLHILKNLPQPSLC